MRARWVKTVTKGIDVAIPWNQLLAHILGTLIRSILKSFNEKPYYNSSLHAHFTVTTGIRRFYSHCVFICYVETRFAGYHL